MINPSNLSDWLVVDGHPGDKIPALKGKGLFDIQGVIPQRIFEQNLGPPWTWARNPPVEGHIKTLKNGENTMYIFHRQGVRTTFWDVFCWADSKDYEPSDDDYKKAEKKTLAVNPTNKLATTWFDIKANLN